MCLVLVTILLSPMAANTVLPQYTGLTTADGSCIVAEAEVSDSVPGTYDQVGGGLLRFVLSVYNSDDNFLFQLTEPQKEGDGMALNSFLHIDANGAIDEWWLSSWTVDETVNDSF